MGKKKDMLLNNDKIVIGYDLSNEYAQISYGPKGQEVPETLSLAEGQEQYNIPVCLFKLLQVNQWFFGKEALNYAKVEEGVLVTSLLQKALVGEEVAIGEENFDPVALLALFVKRSISLLGKVLKREKPSVIMFTVPNLNENVIEVLGKMVQLLDFPECEIYFQGREESIFYYMIHQPKELWKRDVMIYDFSETSLKSYHFTKNRNTTPIVAFVEEKEETLKRDMVQDKDEAFLQILTETLPGKDIGCAYLIGEGFDEEWYRESLRELCAGRRVFKGNNLYSKGACYAAMVKQESAETKDIIFLGKDKLKANVGMQVKRCGQDSYLALLNGGENWYESRKDCDIILTEGNSFEIMITPLDGRNRKQIEIVLDGLPVRENKMTRIHLSVSMIREDTLRILASDMGFGEFAKASSLTFEQQIDLI